MRPIGTTSRFAEDEKQDPTYVELVVPTGLIQENEVGYATQQQLLFLFEGLLNLQKRKSQHYGEAWRSQGYMGNVARVLSKVARLKNMLWRDDPQTSIDEPVEETIGDLMVLAAFAYINVREGNKWGK